jgi:hypothetical protein
VNRVVGSTARQRTPRSHAKNPRIAMHGFLRFCHYKDVLRRLATIIAVKIRKSPAAYWMGFMMPWQNAHLSG